MAVAVVQQTAKAQTDNGDAVAVSFGSLPSAGNAVIVRGVCYQPGATAAGHFTDNQGNTYQLAVQQAFPGFPAVISVIAYAENIAVSGGTFTVTWDIPGSGFYYTFNIMEVSGLLTSGSLDQTNSDSDSGLPRQTGDITTTVADEIIVAVLASGGNGSTTVSGGWTEDWEETNNSLHQPGEADHRIVSATGTFAASWTSGPNSPWSACIASFAGSTPGVTDPLTGVSAGQAGGSGAITRETALQGTSTPTAAVFASLSKTVGMEGTSAGSSAVVGSLSGPAGISGQSDGVATVTGALGLLVPLAGVAAGVAVVSADGAAGGGSGPGGLDVGARPDTAVGAGTYSGAVSLWVDGEEVPRDDRKGLRYGSVVPGGDNHLSVDIDCRSAFFTALGGLPAERTNVEVKSELGDVLWTGWVAKPVVRVAKGAFQGIRLEADGYQYSGLVEPFEDHQVYGPVGVGATSLTKLVTVNVIDAMDHARTQKTPLITNTRYALGAINFDEDTESFFRRTAVDVWNTVNAMISYIGNPMFWQVYSIDNLVTLEFFPHGGGADYFEQGRAKDMSLEFDADEVVWRAGVDFGGEQVFFADAAGGPAIATPYTQSKVVSLEAEAHSLLQVTLLAEKIVSDLNRRRITGGSITIDQPINTTGCANMPPSWLRAGRMIEVTIPADAEPYHTADVGGPISGLMYIRSCEFDEETCTAQLSASPWTDEAKAARVLPFQSTPGLTWGVAFGTFNPPPRVEKLPFVGSTPTPDRTPTLDPIVGSVIPTGYRSDGQHDYGPAGFVADPRSQPKEVVSANYWVTGLITAAGPPPTYAVIPLEDAVIAQAIPEMVVERIELLAALGGPGSITLSFDKFVRATETTSPLYLPNASLTNESFSETVIASADPDPGDPDNRLQFRTGDFIIINVIEPAPVNIKKLSVAIFGRKIWESHMPPTQGPNWVKRPATTSWPHNAGWS